jgi:RNA polymerase sigma-70 factor (ECF subfamily)
LNETLSHSLEAGKDRELVTAAIRGERGAWALLVKCHLDGVWRLAYTLVRDRQMTDDVVHETFMKAQKCLGQFRNDGVFAAWLARICRNCCTDENRRYARHHRTVSIDHVDDEAQTRRLLLDHVVGRPECGSEEDWAMRIALGWAMDQVDDDDREAFLLIKGMGYTSERAAAIAGCAPSTMRSRVSRAKARLASLLGECR